MLSDVTYVRLALWLVIVCLVFITAMCNVPMKKGNVEVVPGRGYRVYWRYPTFLKEITMIIATLLSCLEFSYKISDYSSEVDFILPMVTMILHLTAVFVLLFNDSIHNVRDFSSKLKWIPSYFVIFIDGIIILLINQSMLSTLSLVFLALSIGMVFLRCFSEDSYLQKNPPTVEFTSCLREYMYFAYINRPLIHLSIKKGELSYEDVLGLSDADSAEVIYEKLDKIMTTHPSYSLSRSLFELVKYEWLMEGFFQWIGSTASFVAPLALEKILIFVRYHGDDRYLKEGLLDVNIWTAVFLLFLGPFLKSISEGQNYVRGRHIGVRIKAALICKIYNKSLTVDLSASKESIGKLNNLMSVDVSDIQTFCAYSHYTWSTPYEIVISITLLFLVLGHAALAGLIVMVVTLWFGFYMGKR